MTRHLALILGLFAALLPLLAWACLTVETARMLSIEHPDEDFESLAHSMHAEETIPYAYRGPAGCMDGMSDIFPCQGIELAGWITLPALGGGSGSDNWGWRDPDSGRLFALMGRSNGVAFVEVTNPDRPLYLGNLPRPAGANPTVWTDIKTYQNHAFIVADNVTGHGMQVFNLKELLDPDLEPPVTFSTVARYSGFNQAHNIAINEESGFAYAIGGETCSGGLHMVDISNPVNPVGAGCFGGDGYIHDVQCVNYRGPDSRFLGNEICFASSAQRLSILDVTNKQNVQIIESYTYPKLGFVHQGWLTSDQRFFFLDDEIDETNPNNGLLGTRTLVFDLETLDEAPPAAEFIADGLSIDHNLYVIGDYVFQANYKRGLRILRINDPATADLTEVAYFDTYPEGDGTGFSGAWNVFPFFQNNLLLISDFNRGLFVVRVTDPDLSLALERVFKDRFDNI